MKNFKGTEIVEGDVLVDCDGFFRRVVFVGE